MTALSIVHGAPLSSEAGIGALTIPGYLREVTNRFAEREALIHRTPAGTTRWSYATLWERATEIAAALIASGVGKETRVGILMTNRPEYLAGLFGISMAGGVAVLLSTFSTPAELEHLVQVSGISILLVERKVAGKDFVAILNELGDPCSPKFPFLRRLVVLGEESWRDFIDHGKTTPPELVEARAAAAQPADTGVLFFSSGTTSLPKGILHAHRAVALQWWRWPWIYSVGDDVRVWTANGFFWSGNCSLIVGVAFSSGGTIVLQSLFDPEDALDLMQAERVTLPVASPHQWARIEAAENYAQVDLGILRYVGDKTVITRHPSVRTQWHMPVSFGTTETLTMNTAYPAATPAETKAGSYGVPLPGNILKIIDPLTGILVPQGERGEIAIKGPTLMQGYLGKTVEESFDAEGFYRTLDGGYVDAEGRLFWEGRLSDIIKTGGANVSPVEIDLAIRAYPGVKISQTVGVPHDTLGEIVVACIVPQDDTAIDEAALDSYLRHRLASYKVPRCVLVLREDEMPMTGTAKVKAGLLRELAAKRLGPRA